VFGSSVHGPDRLTQAEYEAVRGGRRSILNRPDHENPEIDRVVVEHDRFATLEKFDMAGAKIARAPDPRRK
jgi:hypothetical protein